MSMLGDKLVGFSVVMEADALMISRYCELEM